MKKEEYFSFDELFLSLPDEGWLTESEALLLLDAAGNTSGSILEVGCYCGRSTVLLASLGRPVISVDPFSGFNSDDPNGEGVKSRFLGNLKKHGVSNVRLYEQRIEAWKVEPCGFAYLDGDHTYQGTINQLDVAVLCGVSEMCIHDWNTWGAGVEIKKAVEDCSGVELVGVVGEMAHCKVVK